MIWAAISQARSCAELNGPTLASCRDSGASTLRALPQ